MKKLATLAAAGMLAFSTGAMKPNEAKADVAGAILVGAAVGITAAALIAASTHRAHAAPVAYHSYAPAAPAFGVGFGVPPFFGVGVGPAYGWGYGPRYVYHHPGYRQRVIVRHAHGPRRVVRHRVVHQRGVHHRAAPRRAAVHHRAAPRRAVVRGGGRAIRGARNF